MTDDLIPVPRELLDALVTDDDCWFDHHGGCQAHGYLSLEHGQLCPQAEAKQLLAAADAAEPVLRPGIEWMREKGHRILDPDGWRLNDGVDIDTTPITEADYERRYMHCTVDHRGERP